MDGKGPTEQLVSPEPEFYKKKRDAGSDEFLVLACDGVWDVMTNEDICSFISARMRVTDNLEQIANEVIDTCLHKVRFWWISVDSKLYNLGQICRSQLAYFVDFKNLDDFVHLNFLDFVDFDNFVFFDNFVDFDDFVDFDNSVDLKNDFIDSKGFVYYIRQFQRFRLF